eukprot:52923_1
MKYKVAIDIVLIITTLLGGVDADGCSGKWNETLTVPVPLAYDTERVRCTRSQCTFPCSARYHPSKRPNRKFVKVNCHRVGGLDSDIKWNWVDTCVPNTICKASLQKGSLSAFAPVPAYN